MRRLHGELQIKLSLNLDSIIVFPNVYICVTFKWLNKYEHRCIKQNSNQYLFCGNALKNEKPAW